MKDLISKVIMNESDNESFRFWKTQLKGAKHILAPMVDQSELAWRLLSRKYGAELCYTPMMHAMIFLKDAKYRRDNLMTTPEDRPLIAQFCANDPDIFLEAARIASSHCDAIDLNLGCPQGIAKRGHYGSFLMDEWDLIYKMINQVHTQLSIPITCKIRVFPEIEKTVEYAKMLEKAGVSLICVHGRTREQKGNITGLASWKHIKAVKESVNIPVFANGNIQYLSDMDNCFKETGVDGVMIAEASLHNPGFFSGKHLPAWIFAEEYIELVRKYPCPLSYVRGHLFKLFHHCLMIPDNEDLREQLARGHSLEVFANVAEKLKERYQNSYFPDEKPSQPFQPFICQPYFRPEQVTPLEEDKTTNIKRCSSQQDLEGEGNQDDEDSKKLSKKKLKRLLRRPAKAMKNKKKEKSVHCVSCANQAGQRCVHQLCKTCCQTKCVTQSCECLAHKLSFCGKVDKSKVENESDNNNREEMVKC